MDFRKRLMLVVLSAGLVCASFPPVGWWVLALVAWVPLVLALKGTTPKLGFGLGFLHGFLVLSVSLSWLWNLFGTASVGLWLIFALFTGIWGGVFEAIRKFTGQLDFIFLALTWVGIEYFRCEIFWLRFPWITPGTAIPPNFMSPIVGVYGMSFLIVFFCRYFFATSIFSNSSDLFSIHEC